MAGQGIVRAVGPATQEHRPAIDRKALPVAFEITQPKADGPLIGKGLSTRDGRQLHIQSQQGRLELIPQRSRLARLINKLDRFASVRCAHLDRLRGKVRWLRHIVTPAIHRQLSGRRLPHHVPHHHPDARLLPGRVGIDLHVLDPDRVAGAQFDSTDFRFDADLFGIEPEPPGSDQ